MRLPSAMEVVVLCVLLCSCLGLADGKMVIRFPTTRCTPPVGDDCVEIRKCPYFDDLLNKNPIPRSRSVIDVIRAHHCDFQGNRPYVCCNKTTTVSPVFDTPHIGRNYYAELDGFFEPLVNHRNYHLLPQKTCGPIMTERRITNGEVTDLSEFPWMALIAYETVSDTGKKGVVFNCAGTLISERFILTAAHCTLDSTMVGVRLGEYDLDQKEDCDPESGYCAPPTQDFFIESIIIHPDYDQRRLLNDIALIKLVGEANFSYANVQPICLPMQELRGNIAVVSGWGVTEEGIRSPILRKASIPVVEFSVCQNTYQKFALLTEKQVCAGGLGGQNSCAGDSGGPLIYVGLVEGTPRFVQHGIVSYGPKQCGTDGKPDIYTKIHSFMHWIIDQLDK